MNVLHGITLGLAITLVQGICSAHLLLQTHEPLPNPKDPNFGPYF